MKFSIFSFVWIFQFTNVFEFSKFSIVFGFWIKTQSKQTTQEAKMVRKLTPPPNLRRCYALIAFRTKRGKERVRECTVHGECQPQYTSTKLEGFMSMLRSSQNRCFQGLLLRFCRLGTKASHTGPYPRLFGLRTAAHSRPMLRAPACLTHPGRRPKLQRLVW